MEQLWMCRICLAEDVQMHLISDTHLQNIYEALTSKPFETEDNRPIFTCYICHAQLQNCYQLKMRCLRSEELLTQMLISKTLNPKDRPITKRLDIVHPVVQLSLLGADQENSTIIDDVYELAIDVKIEHENAEEIEDLILAENRIRTDLTIEENGLSTDITLKENSLRMDVTLEHNPTRTDLSLKDNGLIIAEKGVATDSTLVNSIGTNTTLEGKDVRTGAIIEENTTDVIVEQIIPDKKSISAGLTLKDNVIRTDVTQKENAIRTDVIQKENAIRTDITQKENGIKTKVNLEESSVRTHTTPSLTTGKICPKDLRVVLERITLPNIQTGAPVQEKSSLTIQKENNLNTKVSKAKKIKQKQSKCHFKSHIVNNIKSIIKKNDQSNATEKQIIKRVTFSDINKENIIKIAQLQTIKKIKKKPFICDICKKCFTIKDTLRIHIRAHTQEKAFKCDKCDKRFHQRSAFVMHYRIHTGVKPFECGVCLKAFHRKDCLERHIVIHSGIKPFKCQECGKSFHVLSNLTQHARTHTGDRPFKCNVCGKGFIQRRSLVMHIRIHTDEKPYKCDICKRYFYSSEKLLDHFKVHSKKNPYKCEVCKRHFICNGNYVKHLRKHNKKRSRKA